MCNPINPITTSARRRRLPRWPEALLAAAAAFAAPVPAVAQHTGEAVRDTVWVEVARERSVLAERVEAAGTGVPDSLSLVWKPEMMPVRVKDVWAKPGQRMAIDDLVVTIDPSRPQRTTQLSELCVQRSGVEISAAQDLSQAAGAPKVITSRSSSHTFDVGINIKDWAEGGGLTLGYGHQRGVRIDSIHPSGTEVKGTQVGVEERITDNLSLQASCLHSLQDGIEALEKLEIRAPRPGIVYSVPKQGQLIEAGESLMTLGDEASVEIVTYVDHSTYQSLPFGAFCAAEFHAQPGRSVSCVVSRKNVLSGRYEVVARLLAPPPTQAFSGMSARVTFDVYGPARLTVPVQALFDNNGVTGVLVVQQDSTLVTREVSVRATDGRFVEVLSGVVEGEHVVRGETSTLERLEAGDRVHPRLYLPHGAPADRQDLQAIGLALGNDWLDSRGNLKDVHPSQLRGVTSAPDGTVSEIRRPHDSLMGRIPPQMANLPLRVLDLRHNPQITAGLEVLAEMGQHLRVLLLDGTGFGGELPRGFMKLRLDSLSIDSTSLCIPANDRAFKAWWTSVSERGPPVCKPPAPPKVVRERRVVEFEISGRRVDGRRVLSRTIRSRGGWRIVRADVYVLERTRNATNPWYDRREYSLRIYTYVTWPEYCVTQTSRGGETHELCGYHAIEAEVKGEVVLVEEKIGDPGEAERARTRRRQGVVRDPKARADGCFRHSVQKCDIPLISSRFNGKRTKYIRRYPKRPPL